MDGRRLVAPALLLALVVLAALASAPAAALPGRPASCAATITEQTSDVHVVPSTTETTVATGSAYVFVAKPPSLTVHLTVTAATDTGWEAAPSPRSAVLSNGETTFAFDVVVKLPPGTPAGAVARVTLVVEADAGIIPCQGDTNTAVTVEASPWVERFGGFIVPESMVISPSARDLWSAVEMEAAANARVEVSIDCEADPRITVKGPDSLTLNPQQDGWDNATFDVSLHGPTLPPGTYNSPCMCTATSRATRNSRATSALPSTFPRARGPSRPAG